MANGNLDKFLENWKELENVMRTKKGMEVREWEEKNEGKIEAERLKVCRIIRNYVAHNNTEGFIYKVDNTMIRWIKNFTKDLKKRNKSTKTDKVKLVKPKKVEKPTNKSVKSVSKTKKKGKR